MKIKSLFITFLILVFHTFALKGASIDERVNEVLAPISNTVAGLVFYSLNIGDFSFPLVLGWLIIASLFCTFYFGFININVVLNY